MNQKVEQFFSKAKKWNAEMLLLREIVLMCNVEEDFKWMHPCYTYEGYNIVLIHAFKEYCALLFFKGVLMKDKKGILIQQTENVQDRRQLRFTSVQQIEKLSKTIKEYINEAIEIEKLGLRVEYKKTSEFEMPEEFEAMLKKNKSLKKAFEQLTPGRQRAYLLFFSSAKQPATRIKRIETFLPNIMNGRGKDD